ncbi:MAG: hypothetical protein M3Z16_04960 [Pseudomonadota bacterium]|nr:hypothetical protein [Pseudomonadota bacterium]
MFVGHLAVGVALKALSPKTPTFPIVMGVCVLDVLNGLFVMIGIDRARPDLASGPYMFFDLVFIDWDHSLLMAVVIACLWAWWYRADRRTALLAGLAVFSHFLGDWPVHNNDLALYPYAGAHLGLGLWERLGTAAWALEGAFSVALLGFAAWRMRRWGVSLRWPCSLLALAYFSVSPWLSPLRLAAQLPEPWPHLLLGGMTLLSFVLLGALVTRLIDRETTLAIRPV